MCLIDLARVMKVFDGISMDRAVKDRNDLVEKSKCTLEQS